MERENYWAYINRNRSHDDDVSLMRHHRYQYPRHHHGDNYWARDDIQDAARRHHYQCHAHDRRQIADADDMMDVIHHDDYWGYDPNPVPDNYWANMNTVGGYPKSYYDHLCHLPNKSQANITDDSHHHHKLANVLHSWIPHNHHHHQQQQQQHHQPQDEAPADGDDGGSDAACTGASLIVHDDGAFDRATTAFNHHDLQSNHGHNYHDQCYYQNQQETEGHYKDNHDGHQGPHHHYRHHHLADLVRQLIHRHHRRRHHHQQQQQHYLHKGVHRAGSLCESNSTLANSVSSATSAPYVADHEELTYHTVPSLLHWL